MKSSSNKAKVKRVKAWAVIVFQDTLSARQGAHGEMGLAVFDCIQEAREFCEKENSTGMEQDFRPATCTITYPLPRATRKGKV